MSESSRENWLEVGLNLKLLLLDALSQHISLKVLRVLAQPQQHPDPDGTRCSLGRKQSPTLRITEDRRGPGALAPLKTFRPRAVPSHSGAAQESWGPVQLSRLGQLPAGSRQRGWHIGKVLN